MTTTFTATAIRCAKSVKEIADFYNSYANNSNWCISIKIIENIATVQAHCNNVGLEQIIKEVREILTMPKTIVFEDEKGNIKIDKI